MNYQHKGLAAGRWNTLSLVEQMANIGSEVERALDWQAKHDALHCRRAVERSLDLLDLTMSNLKTFARLKEVARVRDAVADYFFGTNEFQFTDESLRKYFSCFMFAARKNY